MGRVCDWLGCLSEGYTAVCAQKVIRSGVLSPATIESHDLNGPLVLSRCVRCQYNKAERGPDLVEPSTDRLPPGFGPHDVFSDDAGHRPQEMRRSHMRATRTTSPIAVWYRAHFRYLFGRDWIGRAAQLFRIKVSTPATLLSSSRQP
jgi:hypothetical protein